MKNNTICGGNALTIENVKYVRPETKNFKFLVDIWKMN